MKKNNGYNKQSYIFTRETLGMTLLLFCAFVFVALLLREYPLVGLGVAICTFMYGTFGYASYIVVACLAYFGFWLVFEKKLRFKARPTVAISATVLVLFLLFHAVTTRDYDISGYGNYLSQCYSNAELGYAGYSFGGALCSLIVYPFAKFTTFIGAYIIFSVLALLCGYLSFLVIRNGLQGAPAATAKRVSVKSSADYKNQADPLVGVQPGVEDTLYSVNENHEILNNSAYVQQQQQAARQPQLSQHQQFQSWLRAQNAQEQRRSEELVEGVNKFSDKDLGRRILFENGEFAAESYRRNMIFNENSYFNHPVRNDDDYLSSFTDGKPRAKTPSQNQTYSDSYSREVESRTESAKTPSYVFGDKPVDRLEDFSYDEPVFDQSSYGSADDDGGIEDAYFRSIRDDVDVKQDNREENQYSQPFATAQPQTDELAGFRRPAEQNANSFSADNDELDIRRTEDDNFGEAVRNLRQEPAEKVLPEVPSDNSFRNIFSASNSNLTDGEIMPDASRLSSRRQESNANLFDDVDIERESVGFSDSTLGVRGLRAEAGFVDNNTDKVGSGAEANIFDRGRVSPSEFSAEGYKSDSAPLPQNDIPAVTPVAFNPPQAKVEKAPEPVKPKHVWKKYVRPTLDLLEDYPENNEANLGEIEESKSIIVETLSNFRIASHISDVVVGPAITRYDVIIEDKTNIKNAMRYREAIAMALMKENVTAYLNYTKGAISIEVPNSKRTLVGLKSIITSNSFVNCKSNSLTFALGKDVDGKANCPDITKMPHLLVAGTTGSGKSVCISSLIVSLLYKYGPDELRFILVDPKQAEFIPFENLPHLMINEIIYNDVDKAIKALNWAIKEMERRYALFKEMTLAGTLVKNLNEYNANLPEGEEKLPKIVIILDEFGDLMLQAKKDIEGRIIRLVQKSRACGIHLILATQRPSVDCITGLIKSNLPTRIGFKVNSFDDSRTIFDIGGAEKLLSKGDMYYRSAENNDLSRIQGCFIDSKEVQAVTEFVKKNNESYFDQSVADFINTVEEDVTESAGNEDDGADAETKIDDKYIQALKFCVESNQASVSMLQRRFPIGYVKACKIIDWMENMNYITQSEGSKPRKVLLTMDEFRRIFGEIDD